jgi:hypothetical protein
MKRTYHVRIDRVTQGVAGGEKPADRLSIDSKDFLWLYVEAELPRASPPSGEYYEIVSEKPEPGTRVRLEPPTLVNGHYRFSVIHFVLSEHSRYLFHFADDLNTPNYEDRWEIATL